MDSKAFTLIELLAVIIILAIIALISVPIVSNVIDDSEQNAFKGSVESLVEMVETDYSEFARSGAKTYRLGVEKFTCEHCNKDGSDFALKYTGTIEGGQGTIVDNNGTLTVDIYNEYYSAAIDSRGKIIVTN